MALYTPNEDRPWVTQYIMVGDQIFPPFDRPENWRSEYGGYVYSHQFIGVCPFSHKVWLRCPILGREQDPFAVYAMVSEGKSAVWGQIPGSVIPRYPELDHQPWVRHLPKEVLHREVLLHIAAFEKRNK